MKRITWIDWSKVICIYLMVVCHAGQEGLILNMSYQFHMPAFFIISGFLFKPRDIPNELKSFGVPIAFLGIVYLLYNIALEIHDTGSVLQYIQDNRLFTMVTDWAQSLVLYGGIAFFPGDWFIICLLIVRCLMNIRIIRSNAIKIAIVCFVFNCTSIANHLPNIVTDLIAFRVFSAIPLFVTGMFIKQKEIKIIKGHIELKILACIIFFILTQIQGRADMLGYKYGLNYSIFFLNALLGSWLLFNFCSLLPQRNWIRVLSTGTFLILGLHAIIYPYVSTILQIITRNPYLPLLVGMVVLAICYPLIVYLDKHHPLLLGKLTRIK